MKPYEYESSAVPSEFDFKCGQYPVPKETIDQMFDECRSEAIKLIQQNRILIEQNVKLTQEISSLRKEIEDIKKSNNDSTSSVETASEEEKCLRCVSLGICPVAKNEVYKGCPMFKEIRLPDKLLVPDKWLENKEKDDKSFDGPDLYDSDPGNLES